MQIISTTRISPWAVRPSANDDAWYGIGGDGDLREVRRRGAPIDYSLYDAPSGFREFGVQDPDGHDIAIGQPIEQQLAG